MLRAALTDRARTIRRTPGGAKVEGRTPTREVESAWFPARLVPAPSREVEDAGAGRRAVVLTASVVTGAVDQYGVPVDIRASDVVVMADLERWRVTAEPQPLAAVRGRRVGWLVAVERLQEPTREWVA